jgi:hypothetical protein
MKKYLLSIFAIVFAIGLSSFSNSQNASKKSGILTTYWFELDGDPAGTSSAKNVAPAGNCSTVGAGCIEGYESLTPLSEPPAREPDGTFDHN